MFFLCVDLYLFHVLSKMATVSAFVLYDKISSFLVVPCRPRLSISMSLNMLVVIMSIKAMVLVLFTFRLLALGSCSPKMVDLLRSSPIKPYLWFRSSALLLNIDLGGIFSCTSKLLLYFDLPLLFLYSATQL